jgi:hypothetical protein
LSLPSDAERFYFLRHEKPRSGWALAQVVPGGGVSVLFSEDFPRGDQGACIEWLFLRLDGLVLCSQWEWTELCEDDARDKAVAEALQFLRRNHNEERSPAHKAVRTGSPLGRADGVEPPAPAAD